MAEKPLLSNEPYVICIDPSGEFCLLLSRLLTLTGIKVVTLQKIEETANLDIGTQCRLILVENIFSAADLPAEISKLKIFAPGVKIMMISARDGDTKRRALAAGVDLFLVKPFDKRTLLDAILSNFDT